LRFHGIGQESFWYDESVTVYNVRGALGSVVPGVAARDVSPPLYFVVLWAWCRIAGTGEAAVRALSAIGSLVALVLAHRVAARLAGPRVALVTALLFALSPLSLRYAREARMYGLALPLAWGAIALFARWASAPRGRDLAALAALHLALLYTHVFGALVPVVELALLAAAGRSRQVALFALAHVPVALGFLPWVPVLARQAAERSGQFWIGVPDLSSVHYVLWGFSGGVPDVVPGTLAGTAGSVAVRLGYLLAAGAIAWPLLHDAGRRPEAATGPCGPARVAVAVCLAAVGLPLALVFAVSHLAVPLFVDRYFLVFAPFWWMLWALALEALPSRGIRALAVAGLVALTAPMTADQLGRPHKEQWREAIAFMDAQALPADCIVDTGGSMVLEVYGVGPRVPRLSTIVTAVPRTHLSPDELARRLDGVASIWVFFTPYAADPEAYRRRILRDFREVAHARFHRLAVGHYRRTKVP
jgi:hypothetical protein